METTGLHFVRITICVSVQSVDFWGNKELREFAGLFYFNRIFFEVHLNNMETQSHRVPDVFFITKYLG